MNYKDMTIATYDAAAEEIAAHFQEYRDGVVYEEIDESLRHVQNPGAARVVEIGCGAGKEAKELVKKVGWYQGLDPSAKLLDIANKNVPEASFVRADALSYNYPDNLDIVFAFASLLHLDRTDFAEVCDKVYKALRPGGVFCITLKESNTYKSELQEDTFGKRMFYFYNPALVRELAGPRFKQVYEEHRVVGPKNKPWFILILKKT